MIERVNRDLCRCWWRFREWRIGYTGIHEGIWSGKFLAKKVKSLCFILLLPSPPFTLGLFAPNIIPVNSFSLFLSELLSHRALVSSMPLLRTSSFYSYSLVNPIRSFFKTPSQFFFFFYRCFRNDINPYLSSLPLVYATLKVAKSYKNNKYHPTRISGSIRQTTIFINRISIMFKVVLYFKSYTDIIYQKLLFDVWYLEG